MVELVDTLVSGTSAIKSMEVRVFFWAKKAARITGGFFCIRTEEDSNFRKVRRPKGGKARMDARGSTWRRPVTPKQERRGEGFESSSGQKKPPV